MDLKLINHREVQEWLLGVIAVIVLISEFIRESISGWESIWWWIELIAIVISIPLLFMWWTNISLKYKLRFGIIGKYYKPFKVTENEPVDGDWSIRVHSPNMPIKDCSILLNNKELPWANEKELEYKRDIELGGGGNVRIPRKDFPESIIWHARGKIMEEGKKTRCEFRFAKLKDIYKGI